MERTNGTFALGLNVNLKNGEVEVTRNIFNNYVPDEVIIMQLKSYLRNLEIKYYRKYDLGS